MPLWKDSASQRPDLSRQQVVDGSRGTERSGEEEPTQQGGRGSLITPLGGTRRSKDPQEPGIGRWQLLGTHICVFRLRMTPQSQGYFPYEIVYGRPPPIIIQLSTNLPQVRGDRISQQMELGKVINGVTKFVQERVLFTLGEQSHEFTLGHQIWVKDRKHGLLALC